VAVGDARRQWVLQHHQHHLPFACEGLGGGAGDALSKRDVKKGHLQLAFACEGGGVLATRRRQWWGTSGGATTPPLACEGLRAWSRRWC